VVAEDITANLPAGLAARTVAVDRMALLTIYVGTNRGAYCGHSADGGTTWSWTPYNNGLPLANVIDLEVHPITGVMRAGTYGRGGYEVNTDFPIGSLLSAEGRVTFLRGHDVGTGWGPPTDFLDVEAVMKLDSLPGKAFGFQLRTDANEESHTGMLDLLRDAFNHNRPVRIDYLRTGLRNGQIIRVMDVI
jgi:hypothetical protein